MKRVVSRILPPLVLVFTLAAIFVISYQPGLPSDAQVELDDYLLYLQGQRGTLSNAVQVNQASQPGQFTADMSRSSYGNSPYYRTTTGYQSPWPQSAAARESAVIQENGDSRRAIPYPVENLWCVYLDGGQSLEVVYLALHEDMYNAGWLVHEGLASAADPRTVASLTEIGCPLEAAGLGLFEP
jgi:hypothetical protein